MIAGRLSTLVLFLLLAVGLLACGQTTAGPPAPKAVAEAIQLIPYSSPELDPEGVAPAAVE